MTVRSTPILLVPLLLGACKVEPTPRSFYNHRDPAVVELQESEGEIRTRVINFVAAVNRGDSAAAMEAMNPAELVQVLGPAPADSMARLGPAGLRDAVAALRVPAGGVARTPDLRVSSGQGMGWFATHVEILPTGSGPSERLRLSGVFVRDRGDWRLVQAHLAQADTLRPAAADSAAADSATAESVQPRPNPRGAPGEDG